MPLFGKGDAAHMSDALEKQSVLPRGTVLVLTLLLLIGLFFSRPTATQFYQHIWIQALAGMKSEIRAKAENNPATPLMTSILARVPFLLDFIKAGNNAELDKLPAFWMEHTTVRDWQIVTYFRYDEENCFSDYLGVAGMLVNLKDGCDVEPYRTKGGSL